MQTSRIKQSVWTTIGHLRNVDRLNTWVANLSSWALLFMTLIVTYQVAARYLFSSPTVWAWDITVQLMLMLLMLGMADAYKKDVHVTVDVITMRLSARHRAWLGLLHAPVYFALMLILVWTSWKYFYSSFESMQRASTSFRPLLYPVKFMLPLGATLLLIQGVVKLIYDLQVACGLYNPRQGRDS